MGRRESTTVSSVEVKNITGAASTNGAPQGRQVLGTQQSQLNTGCCGSSLPSSLLGTINALENGVALAKNVCTANNEGTFLHLPVQKIPSLLEDGTFLGC